MHNDLSGFHPQTWIKPVSQSMPTIPEVQGRLWIQRDFEADLDYTRPSLKTRRIRTKRRRKREGAEKEEERVGGGRVSEWPSGRRLSLEIRHSFWNNSNFSLSIILQPELLMDKRGNIYRKNLLANVRKRYENYTLGQNLKLGQWERTTCSSTEPH